MKKFNLICLALLMTVLANAQNLQFAAQLPYSVPLSNIGGYVDSLNNEYALVGTGSGLSIVDVTTPASPVIKFNVPGPTSDWREVKTYHGYAYIVTEGGGGMTIVNLRNLPATINYKQYTGDGAISGQLNTIHALHVDTTKGYLYLYGSNIGSGNSLFFSLADPWNPTYAGQYVYPGGGNSSYVHDGYAENDTLYEGHIYSGFFAIVDVRNKSNPVLLATQGTPTSFTHNTWLSEDHKTLFTTDENANSFLAAYDITDPLNIQEKSRFQTAPGSNSIVHNTHILNGYAVTSWYTQGVVITDVSRPDNPIEVGKYDTYPQGSGNTFNGCWGVYPFLPSGTIVASDIDNGLFVLTPTYVRGAYLEGVVTDSATGFPLAGASVTVINRNISKTTSLTGEYKTGTATADTVDILVVKAGYVSKTVTGIVLANGQLTQVDVQLVSVATVSIQGVVVDSASGDGIANANVLFHNVDFDILVTTDQSGSFTVNSIVDGAYDITIGKWGYETFCGSVQTAQTPFSFSLKEGYQDDFSFDYGWTVLSSSPNVWQRGEPNGTFDNTNNPVNPEYDATGDCGEICYVTDNTPGGSYSSHDVDNGFTRLYSPVFDLSGYVNPEVSYDRWFVNIGGTGNPNDTLKMRLSNGIDTVTIDAVNINSAGQGVWYHTVKNVANYITPTSTMKFIVEAEDYSPGHVFEGGIDNFKVEGVLLTALDALNNTTDDLKVYPNPSAGKFTIVFPEATKSECTITVLDARGRVVEERSVLRPEMNSGINMLLGAGFYTVMCTDSTGKTGVVKVIVH